MGTGRRLAALGAAATAALVVAPRLQERADRKSGDGLVTASESWRGKITSHETFTHDSIDSLGYDWERIGNPHVKPKYPLKVYLPQTTEDVIKIVREAKLLGEKLVLRSKGHSSNDLVLADRGSVIVTQKMDKILALDEEGLTVTVQAGAINAELDDHLAHKGLGLPVIGDHKDISVGGFASVGGISPASHRFGMFVDNVERLEYVTWDGEVIACSRTENPEHFYRVLAGYGQHGVMTTATLRLIRIDKYRTILENDQTYYTDVDAFIAGSGKYIVDPGDALMERGVWADLVVGERRLRFGQFSAYRATPQNLYARLRNQASYGYLHRIGYIAGRLPTKADKLLKYVGIGGVLLSPSYASYKNVEFFTDKILDSTVGDPTRMLIVLAPLEQYPTLFRESYDLMVEFRERYGCMTLISVYVKSIKSPYLAQGKSSDRFCELMFYVGVNPLGMTEDVLNELVERFDDICIAHNGFRYMHTRTTKDPERRAKVDPNAFYSRGAVPAEIPDQVAIPAD
ncbi:MAG: FAD-binding oxidoreductase [Chloroflexota bacterium]|nr:FAD-binding oxidoreductase [Chloroflexota bacterium]